MSGRVRAGDRPYLDLTPGLPATPAPAPDARSRARALVLRQVPDAGERRVILAALGLDDAPPGPATAGP